ncbi:MAG: AAA family ATPase [Gluconobacter japonicus]|uniref:AAA family ATPase n=1 Tax=Gluconobacter japonicus TaxID=376620 RepID=UPI0039EAABBD
MAFEDFRLRSCDLVLGDRPLGHINFLAKNTSSGLHITLVMGSNGTGKSWLLASLIDNMVGSSSTASSHRSPRGPFVCKAIKTTSTDSNKDILPSRILALSTLVRDRFPFVRTDRDDGFYKYLGVRQATNLTTTGALDASVGEAVVSLALDSIKVKKLKEWLSIFFPDAEIGIGFPSLDIRFFDRYFSSTSEEESGSEAFLSRRMGRNRFGNLSEAERINLIKHYDSILTFLKDVPRGPVEGQSNRSFPILSFGDDKFSVQSFINSIANMPSKQYGLNYVRPTLMIRLENWISFDQLSSGEQNLLSVGAKLLAYALPGSFIVIDEPEVSLNTSWQQRYLDMISSSLEHASGSHVLIATHSPHFVSGLRDGSGTIVLVRREKGEYRFDTRPAAYEAWGAESILYEVLDIPSASNFAFNDDLLKVLQHIQENGQDPRVIRGFLAKAQKLRFDDSEPLGDVIKEIEQYATEHGITELETE